MVKSPAAPLIKYQDALINSESRNNAIMERVPKKQTQMHAYGKHRKKERGANNAAVRHQHKASDRYMKKVRRDKTRSVENQREAEAYISFQQKREEKKLQEFYEQQKNARALGMLKRSCDPTDPVTKFEKIQESFQTISKAEIKALKQNALSMNVKL